MSLSNYASGLSIEAKTRYLAKLQMFNSIPNSTRYMKISEGAIFGHQIVGEGGVIWTGFCFFRVEAFLIIRIKK